MLILLTVFSHFEFTFRSEPIITLKPSSYELQEINMNVTLLLSWVSPETDPERSIRLQVVYITEGIPGSTNRRVGEWGSKQYSRYGCVTVQVAIVGLSPTGDPETQWRTCPVIVPTPQRARVLGAFNHQFPSRQRAAGEASACWSPLLGVSPMQALISRESLWVKNCGGWQWEPKGKVCVRRWQGTNSLCYIYDSETES